VDPLDRGGRRDWVCEPACTTDRCQLIADSHQIDGPVDFRVRKAVRQKSNFLSSFNLIWAVQISRQK
jgi:hypothetical protein